MPAGDCPSAGFGVEQRGAVPRERGGTGSKMETLQAQGQGLPSLLLCRNCIVSLLLLLKWLAVN